MHRYFTGRLRQTQQTQQQQQQQQQRVLDAVDHDSTSALRLQESETDAAVWLSPPQLRRVLDAPLGLPDSYQHDITTGNKERQLPIVTASTRDLKGDLAAETVAEVEELPGAIDLDQLCGIYPRFVPGTPVRDPG